MHESEATEPVGVFTFEIESAEATKVNEITVTFADSVEAENVTFTVTKGTESVPIEKVEATDWSIDETEVKLTTSANMTKGTYTVTATDSVTEDTASADFEVEAQKIEGIVILNKTALTNKDKDEAYAYYDVVDQYGTSIRSSASIQWSGSCKIKADKATGKLTLTKNAEGDDWVYNEQIYITGVYTKTGVAKSETLTVGSEQALNSIEMVGFLKKGTSEIVEDLPKDFKEKEYYLLFHALDQNDCPLEAEDITKDDVTFISNDILVVKELVFDATTEAKSFTVKGVEYNGIFVTPGIRVADGGEVTVTAIANKTGTKTELNFIVGEDPVVVSFTLGSPSGVVADGDQGVAIPFEALDQDGEPITNFKALAKQEIFNTLSFNTSEGTLRLAEQNDRTAKLTWSDKAMEWTDGQTTDDIDRPVSLTVVIVGGEPDNEMIYVSDKRRPNAIADVNLNDVYVEGAEFAFTITEDEDTDSFKYYDQYGVAMGTWGADNGFFEAAAEGELKGTEFAGYAFGVRIEYAGTGKVELNEDDTDTASLSEDGDGNPDGKKAVIQFNEIATYNTTTDIKAAATGEGFKFDIAKFKEPTNPAEDEVVENPTAWDSISPTKFKGLTVVDITQVKNFKIGSLNTFYTGELNITGDKIVGSEFLADLKSTAPVTEVTGVAIPASHIQKIKVTGTYNGSTVSIPGDYFTIETTKGSLVDDNNTGADNKTFDKIGEIDITSLYDRTTANGNAKLGEDEVKATIKKVHDGYGWWAYDEDLGLYVDESLTQEAATATLTPENRTAGALDVANAILDDPIGEADLEDYEGDTQADALTDAKAALVLAQGALEDAQNAATEAAANLAAAGKGDAVTATAINYIIAEDTLTAGSDAGDITDAVEAYDNPALTADQQANAKAYLTLYVADLEAQADLAEAEANVEAAQADVDEATTKAEAETAVKAFEAKFDAAKAANEAGTKSSGDGGTYDTAKAAITFSDQAPYAADIKGLKDAYTFGTYGTEVIFYDADQKLWVAQKVGDFGSLTVVDQYGVTMNGETLEFTISNAVEDKEGYAENNFTVADNGTDEPAIIGAELGDTFDLTVSVAGTTIKKTTKVTIGADRLASIENSINYYTNGDDANGIPALKDILEEQRLAGLQ